MVCVVGRMRDLILQLSKSSIYSTKPILANDLPDKLVALFMMNKAVFIDKYHRRAAGLAESLQARRTVYFSDIALPYPSARQVPG